VTKRAYFSVFVFFAFCCNCLQQLITNEHVQEMVRNTIMEEEGSVQSKLKEAIFEPKMTRSKLREVMETGQMMVSAVDYCDAKSSILSLFVNTLVIRLPAVATLGAVSLSSSSDW